MHKGENMKEKVTVGKIWGVIHPMLLYTAITYLIIILLMIVLTVVMMVTTGETNENIIVDNIMLIIQNQAMLLTFFAAAATIPLLVYFRHKDIQREKLNNRYKKYKVSAPKYLLIVPFGIFCMLSANYFVSILTVFMPDFMTQSYAGTEEAIYGSNILVQILGAVLAGPIVEELIFRGLVYDRVKRMSSVIPAAIISSLAFGIFHGNWVQAPYAFIIGMVCVFVYEKYKNMAAPILLHISANFLSVVISYAARNVSTVEETAQVSDIEQVIVCAVCTWVTGALAVAVGMVIKNVVNPRLVQKES